MGYHLLRPLRVFLELSSQKFQLVSRLATPFGSAQRVHAPLRLLLHRCGVRAFRASHRLPERANQRRLSRRKRETERVVVHRARRAQHPRSSSREYVGKRDWLLGGSGCDEGGRGRGMSLRDHKANGILKKGIIRAVRRRRHTCLGLWV